MKRCIIITGYIDRYQSGTIGRICPELFSTESSPCQPLLLCADGGYRPAQKEGLIPQVIIGDFDTFDDQEKDTPEVSREIIRVPVEKDDSDTMLCIKYGLDQGCDSFLLIGGLGGRLDHTFANLQALAYATLRGADILIKDEETCVMMRRPGRFILHRTDPETHLPYRRFSLFSWTPVCEGISIQGAKYCLQNGRLQWDFPLGVSNEFEADDVEIRWETGMMLVIMNRSN